MWYDTYKNNKIQSHVNAYQYKWRGTFKRGPLYLVPEGHFVVTYFTIAGFFSSFKHWEYPDRSLRHVLLPTPWRQSPPEHQGTIINATVAPKKNGPTDMIGSERNSVSSCNFLKLKENSCCQFQWYHLQAEKIHYVVNHFIAWSFLLRVGKVSNIRHITALVI